MKKIYSLLFCFLIFTKINVFGSILPPSKETFSIEEMLLPENHELQPILKNLFTSPDLFETPNNLRSVGFKVLSRMHRGLMVIKHPSIEGYLFKKFQNFIPQKKQTKNFLARANGAKALREFIRVNEFQHIIVPKKWLYPLPEQFSPNGETTYILIVEEMDIKKGGNNLNKEIGRQYETIELETLRELCTVLYFFRGLDSVLHNIPFTSQNKLTFIDTEKWEENRSGFLHYIYPCLTKDRQKFVNKLYKEIQSDAIK